MTPLAMGSIEAWGHGSEGWPYHRLTAVPKDALSTEEIQRINRLTESPALIAGRLFASHPRLIPHALNTALRGAATAVKADPTIGWIMIADRVRRIAPGAVYGAAWGGLEMFVTTFGEHVGKDQAALEVGCGGGRVTRRLLPLVAQLDAVDVSEFILDEARIIAPRAHYFTVAGFGDSLPDERYDAVASHDVFVHFELDECAQYLCNIARTLRPKGVFVFSVYTLDSEAECEEYRTAISNSMRPPASDSIAAGLRPVERGLTARRVRRFPSATYEKLFDTFGFEVIDRRRSRPDEYAGGETPHLNFVVRKL